jgi:DNA-binding MarR family transcriptional regulator
MSGVAKDVDELLYDEPIVEVFGTPSNVRILKVLSDASGAYLTIASIAEEADVTKQSVYNNSDRLEELGLIEPGYKNNNRAYRMPREEEVTDTFEELRDLFVDNT